VALDREAIERMGVRLHAAPLLDATASPAARHDPRRLATMLRELAHAATTHQG
jgi:hypothetical protein